MTVDRADKPKKRILGVLSCDLPRANFSLDVILSGAKLQRSRETFRRDARLSISDHFSSDHKSETGQRCFVSPNMTALFVK